MNTTAPHDRARGRTRSIESGRERRAVVVAVLAALTLIGGSCASDRDAESSEPQVETSVAPPAPDLSPISAEDLEAVANASESGDCEELDATRCLLPFPSNRFTKPQASAPTGLLVDLPIGQLANLEGSTLDVTEWNRNDGFSPGSPMLISAPGVDLAASGVAPIGDIGASMAKDSASMLVDLETGKRLAHWVELDMNAPDGQRLLIVRPAAALPEGHEIGVYLGELVGQDGEPLVASAGFRAYRDALDTDLDAIEGRRDDMERVMAAGIVAGMERSTMYAAWSFTVASQQNLSGRLLAMRDDAYSRLDGAAPRFTVDQVITEGLPEGIGRRVVGTYFVPSYLSGLGESGSRLFTDSEGLPTYAGYDFPAGYTCQIPQVAIDGAGQTSRPVVYGHGLLGSKGEAENDQVAAIASTNDMVYCATDWIGMSSGDVGTAIEILRDLSKFPALPDRSQQGILNTVVLATAMTGEDGFSTHPAFASTSGRTVFDRTEAYFDGNSQGGIMGGAATAISTEWTRAVLGVPGMNYALLLSRSVDFDKYFAVLRTAYPDPIDQMLVYPLLSMLWDRAESNGYAQHLTTDPYEGTEAHQVVLDVAFGDHQVAPVAAEVMARTIGAGVRAPALADGRHPDRVPWFGLDLIDEFPTDRSVLVYWDSGSLPPPPANVTPVASADYLRACEDLGTEAIERDPQCADSHEDPRRAPGSIEQKDQFFRPDGQVHDPCDGEPCTAVHRRNLPG